MQLDSLVEDLDSPDPFVRDHAISKLERETRNGGLPVATKEPLLRMMETEVHWAMHLQIVRLLPRLTWTGEEYQLVLAYLFKQAEGANRFIKAWALDSLATFAQTDPTIEPRVVQMLVDAMEMGSAAIRVRARHGLARIERTRPLP